MTDRVVVVFGGTGFLGRCVVRHLLDHGFAVRAATRHGPTRHGPERYGPEHAPSLQFVRADVNDRSAVEAALAGAYAAVNAVSLYVERGDRTFRSVHVEAAGRVASCARQAGIVRRVHLSGIGADPASRSPYIRSRGEGEASVRAEFATAAIIRPAVMFGPGDHFLTSLAGLLRRLPFFPMFGDGSTRLQPAHVDDVAEAIARILDPSRDSLPLYEFGGPQVLSYRALLQLIAARNGWRRRFLALPFPLWHGLAALAELLPDAPLTRNQVELMQCDTVASAALPGFATLGIAPLPIASALEGQL
jgi:NADH dehydrogenase